MNERLAEKESRLRDLQRKLMITDSLIESSNLQNQDVSLYCNNNFEEREFEAKKLKVKTNFKDSSDQLDDFNSLRNELISQVNRDLSKKSNEDDNDYIQ